LRGTNPNFTRGLWVGRPGRGLTRPPKAKDWWPGPFPKARQV